MARACAAPAAARPDFAARMRPGGCGARTGRPLCDRCNSGAIDRAMPEVIAPQEGRAYLGCVIQPALPSPLRDAASSDSRARRLLMLAALVVAAVLMIALAASPRPAGTGLGGSGVGVIAGAGPDLRIVETTRVPRDDASLGGAEIAPDADLGAVESAVVRAASYALGARRADAAAYPPALARGAASLSPGSPHRPPRAA